ncbi:MAG: PQQ-dependent sugar dehydrogenase [Bacteroidales bacterium]
MKLHLVFLLMFSFLFSCASERNDSQPGTHSSGSFHFSLDTLATGLENPWSMAFLPDGRILIAERPGRLRIFADGQLQPDPVEGIPQVWANGQGGLLEVVLHPDYENNGWIYLGYSLQGNGGGNTAISRGRLQGNQFTDHELLFHGQPHTGAGHHFGTRIVFDRDHYLFTTIGDRGQMDNAQTLSNHNGKVLRINDDGSVPADNPFTDDTEARNEIWSYGHRNIQGMALHPATGQLWAHEHGARGGDEINRIIKGENYGWPEVTHGIDYDGSIISPDTTREGMVDPIYHWTPSIAPCGMTFVTGDRYPQWENNILAGALAGQHIHRVVLEGDQVVQTEKLLEGMARFRAVQQSPDGYIYVLTESPGLFFRIIPLDQ